MALIFNIRAEGTIRNTVAIGLVGEEAVAIAASYQSQRVALGLSHVAGVWTVVATGTLAGYWCRQNVTYVVITDISPLPETLRLVTGGDIHTDSLEQPYGMDTLEAADAARIFGLDEIYAHMDTPRLLAAEEVAAVEFDAIASRKDEDSWTAVSFVQRLGAAYKDCCTFTGLKQLSLDGRRKEGVVIGVDGGFDSATEALGQGLFVSRTVGFCYRNGLLAIGEDYDILRHPQLSAEVRVLLEMVNRRAVLFLPEDQSVWPDLEAARRHRRRFGY